MQLTSSVEEIIADLAEAGLADVAADLRMFLEQGVEVDTDGSKQHDGQDGEENLPRRRRDPVEEVNDAVDYLQEQLVRPTDLIAEAKAIAGNLTERGEGSRTISLMDMRFEEARAYPAVSEEEREVIKQIAAIFPLLREEMLATISGRRRGE